MLLHTGIFLTYRSFVGMCAFLGFSFVCLFFKKETEISAWDWVDREMGWIWEELGERKE